MSGRGGAHADVDAALRGLLFVSVTTLQELDKWLTSVSNIPEIATSAELRHFCSTDSDGPDEQKDEDEDDADADLHDALFGDGEVKQVKLLKRQAFQIRLQVCDAVVLARTLMEYWPNGWSRIWTAPADRPRCPAGAASRALSASPGMPTFSTFRFHSPFPPSVSTFRVPPSVFHLPFHLPCILSLPCTANNRFLHRPFTFTTRPSHF
jgi:hypothetical protein